MFKYMNIEAERVRNGLSKKDLADKLGVSKRTYYNWISGVKPMPHTKLKKMSYIFGVKVDYLLEELEPQQPTA